MISVLASVALFLAVPAGHTLFWIGLVNRAHAIDLGHDNLHRLHKLHNVAIVGAAVAWFLGAGLFGPRLLRGGSWRDLSGPMAVFAIGCCVVATGWGVCWLSRRLSPRPRRILSRVATRRDLEPELSAPARGVGPYQKLLNVPGNEFLHLEIVELELRLPRLPAEWDGLSIVHLSDIHLIGTVGLPYFERLFEIANSMNGDLVAFTGDLLDDPKLVAWLDSTFGKSTAPLGCHFILGNHDREWGDIAASRKRLSDLGWNDASSQTRQLEYRGRTLAIAGTERPWMGTDPDWSGVPNNAFRLLLSHTPDQLNRALRDQVDLMLAGHTHGGQVRLPIIGPVYAPSIHGVKYASGTFWIDPMLMQVSQGIAGRHPWRWNCPPELTKLVLRSDQARNGL